MANACARAFRPGAWALQDSKLGTTDYELVGVARKAIESKEFDFRA
jgi:hypothetical protein